MHNGKYRCHMAASCTHHYQPWSPSCSKTATKKKRLAPNKSARESSGRKLWEWKISVKSQDRGTGLAEKPREEKGKGNQTTAPRFWTGGHHRQHPLRGKKEQARDTKTERESKWAREQGRESRESNWLAKWPSVSVDTTGGCSFTSTTWNSQVRGRWLR